MILQSALRLTTFAVLTVLLTLGRAVAVEPEAMRDRALELVNADRANHSLPPLRQDDALQAAAQAHAEDMAKRDYFSHTAPDGTSVLDRFLEAGGSHALVVAENIGACGPCPTEDVVGTLQRGWMNSEGHRENILDPGVEQFGFGVAGDADRLLAVQTFAGPGTGPPGAEDQTAPADPIDAQQQHALAVDLINARRAEADAPPLTAAPTLGEALGAQVPEDHLGDFSLDGVTVPMAAGGDSVDWRRMFLVGGRCGGCGIEVTANDVRFFVNQWLDTPRYRDALLDPAQTHIGLTVSADGTGAKVALAAIAGE